MPMPTSRNSAAVAISTSGWVVTTDQASLVTGAFALTA